MRILPPCGRRGGVPVRVIAGELGGRRLSSPAGRATRPTLERVREALFSMLASRLEACPAGEAGPWGEEVLDLFAGSGALGIEALSRGAARATFVERDRAALRVLSANLAALGLRERSRVVPGDVFAVLDRLRRPGGYSLILADPPYREGLAPRLLERLGAGGWLAPSGICAIEHATGEDLAPEAGNLSNIAQRTYGETRISLYRAVAGGC